MAKTYLENSATIKVLDSKGEESVAVVTETQKKSLETLEQEEIAKAEKSGGTAEVIKRQSFEFTVPESWDEIATLVPNEQARIAHYVRGLNSYQGAARKEFMVDENQAAVEGAYSLISDCQEPRERRKADPLARGAKDLSDVLGVPVSASDFAEFVEMFKASRATPATA